jgi:hypothetical protein
MIRRWEILKKDELHDDYNQGKGDRWILSLIIMWKKMKKRGADEGLKLFRPSFTISTIKPFNQGILKLQEEFEEALRNPTEYVLREGIEHMLWQHLGLKLNEKEVDKFVENQWDDRKLSKVRIPLPFHYYSKELYIESDAIYVCKVLNCKVYSNQLIPNLFISQYMKENCYGADIYIIEKSNEVVHADKYAEFVPVPFYSVERRKMLLMKLDDLNKTGDIPTRIIAGCERILGETIQPLCQKYVSEIIKIGNILIMFPISAVKENGVIFANYFDDMKNKMEIVEMYKRCGEVLEELGYTKKICNAQGEYVEVVHTSSEGNTEEISAA